MITNYITSFVEYLNNAGYQITNDKIKIFFEMFSYGELDFSDTEEIIAIMKIIFCHNQVEASDLPKHFYAFQKKFEQIKEQRKREEKERENKEKQVQELIQKQNELNSVIKSEKKKIADEEAMYKEKMESILAKEPKEQSPITKKDKQFLKNNRSKIPKLSLSQKQNEFLLAAESDDLETCSKMKDKEFEKFKDRLLRASETALSRGNFEQFNFIKTLHSIVSKFDNYSKKETNDLNRALERAKKDHEKNMAKIQEEATNAQIEQKRIQNELTQALKVRDIEKDTVVNHREEFKTRGNSVRVSGQTPDCVDKVFKKLSNKDKRDIYNYIKQNLLKFKTRMNRNINTLSKREIDIERTIQNACKTGGVPLQLAFHRPTRGKSDLVLVLDISGSCKDASEMMLTFMYMLKDVFSNGCKTYVFIDKLYDISEIMESTDLNSCIDNIIASVPRNYSNYYIPLKSLWEDHKKDITKNSMVIFIGDARNNNNPHGTEYLRDISRRAKRCYWLNTETFDKWGKQDSLAFEYSRYSKMYEVTTVQDIIGVLNEMR